MNMKTHVLLLTTILTLTTTIARADFGETFGASVLGSTIGSFAGSTISHAVCNPPPCRRVVVEEVRVPETMPARRRKMENLEAKYQAELDTLYEKKESTEHRIQRLEQELGDIDKAIESHEALLKNLRTKKHHTGREIAEITVE